MKKSCCFPLSLVLFGLIPFPAWGDDRGELRKLTEALPARLVALYKENEEGFAGSTAAMADASRNIGYGLLPHLMELVSFNEGLSGEETTKRREEILRDAGGVAADVYYSSHAMGWGGTITKIEAAAAFSSHIETRICYEVTMLHRDDEGFDLADWYERWAKAGGSTGASLEDRFGEEESSEAGIRLEGGELKFDPGASGGMLKLDVPEMAGTSADFYAKAGQRLVLASMGLGIRLEKVTEEGKFVEVGSGLRALDTALPESKGGRYRLRFSKAVAETEEGLLLLEIR